MVYIYLNIYPNGLLYVGFHKWNGEGIDPNYKGSSHVAKAYGWVPEKIVLLQEVTDEDHYLNSEHYWIERFAQHYGIAECARVVGGPKCERWASRFKVGRLINLHSNDASYATEASRNPVSRNKMTATRTESGAREKSVRAMLDSLTHESRQLAADNKDYKEIAKKVAKTKKGMSGTYRICSTIFNGEEVVGSVQTVCRCIGHENWNVHLSRKFKAGAFTVNHHGFTFKLLGINKKILK